MIKHAHDLSVCSLPEPQAVGEVKVATERGEQFPAFKGQIRHSAYLPKPTLFLQENATVGRRLDETKHQ